MAGLLGSQTPQRFGLLSPDVMSMIQRGASGTFLPAPAPQRAPERPRGQPGFLTQLLGGTEGLEAERARRRAEEMRPQQEARMAEMRAAASRMGPEAMIAFETNPEAFGESLGMQYRPVTTAAGSITSYGPGENSRRVGAPVVDRFDDRHGVLDPLNPQAGTQYTDPRGPTFGEDTARMAATRPIELAPGTVALNRDGSTFGQGAPRIFSAADATDLVGEDGNPIYQNVRDAPLPDPGAADRAASASEGRLAMADNLATGLTGARRFASTAGVWSRFNPLNQQNRANLEAHLETLKGNITFERLSDMKANSANGASGLGALSDNEARMLASTVAALSPDMSPQELEGSFAVIDRLVAKLREEGSAPASAPAPAGQPGPPRVSTRAQYDALPSGAAYLDPNGVRRIKQ